MAENSLHLEFDSLNIEPEDKPTPPTPAEPEPPKEEPAKEAAAESKERKKPYVNPERVRTGGSQRDKLSEEELAERMARIREQNEKIKQRRVDVQADEEAFRKTQEAFVERAKRTRKVQESVDNAREQNAKRKMEKVQSREWDSGKPAANSRKGQPVQSESTAHPESTTTIETIETIETAEESTPTTSRWMETPQKTETDESSVASSMWARGSGSGRGRGGRGRGGRRGSKPSAEGS